MVNGIVKTMCRVTTTDCMPRKGLIFYSTLVRYSCLLFLHVVVVRTGVSDAASDLGSA